LDGCAPGLDDGGQALHALNAHQPISLFSFSGVPIVDTQVALRTSIPGSERPSCWAQVSIVGIRRGGCSASSSLGVDFSNNSFLAHFNWALPEAIAVEATDTEKHAQIKQTTAALFGRGNVIRLLNVTFLDGRLGCVAEVAIRWGVPGAVGPNCFCGALGKPRANSK